MIGPTEVVRPAEGSHSTFDGRLDGFVTAASFWLPIRSGEDSEWTDHAPFAFWLIDALRPRCFVELGTASGYSYSVICQAVQNLGLTTKCFAVDPREEGNDLGSGGSPAHDDLVTFNDLHFSAFSRLVHSNSDEARNSFEDRSIDLLHIDGRHSYDRVNQDYSRWLPKLSPDAVVVFHNINVRGRGFGVDRLWEELKPRHPHFEFLHGNGLGILGRGTQFLPGLMFDQREMTPELASNIRSAYSRLGAALTVSHEAIRKNEARLASALAMISEENQRDSQLSMRCNELEGRITTLIADLAESKYQQMQQKSDLAQKSLLVSYLHALLGTQSHQIQQLKTRLAIVDPVFEAAAMASRLGKGRTEKDLLTSEVSNFLVEELRLGAVVDEVALARRLEGERMVGQETTGERETGRASKYKSWLRRRS